MEKISFKTMLARAGRTVKEPRVAKELSVAGDSGQSGAGVFRYPSGTKVAALQKLTQLIFGVEHVDGN